MKLQFIFSVFIQLLIAGAFHAQRVFPLFNDISVDSVLQPKMWASKMAFDPITQHLFYTTAGGDIYEVFEATQSDSLRFSVTDHGIPKVQGLCFVDSTGFSPISPWGSACPFVDPSRELVMLRFSFDSTNLTYGVHTTNVASGFYLPVDAVQVGPSIYVIENNGGLWKINFPKAQTPPSAFSESNFIYPNPCAAELNCYFPNPNQQKRHIELLSLDGKVIYQSDDFTTEFYQSDISTFSQGGYFVRLIADGEVIARQKIVFN